METIRSARHHSERGILPMSKNSADALVRIKTDGIVANNGKPTERHQHARFRLGFFPIVNHTLSTIHRPESSNYATRSTCSVSLLSVTMRT
jgi:hypothetical protein